MEEKKGKRGPATKKQRIKAKRLKNRPPKPPVPPQGEPREKLNKQGLRRIADTVVRATILEMCREAGLDGSVKPEAIAQAVYPEKWQTMLKRVRLMAKQMALAGDLVILRKGELADPEEVKGLIRLQITEQGLTADEEE
ncbi:MAG: DUF3253 domain-containing protein [Ardenticatenaceae bacterium]|nr:DUF3253 domain-containing protein [Ardenticatenaceae bacterium]